MTVQAAIDALLKGRVIYVQFDFNQWPPDYFEVLEKHIGQPVLFRQSFSARHQVYMAWIKKAEKRP